MVAFEVENALADSNNKFVKCLFPSGMPSNGKMFVTGQN